MREMDSYGIFICAVQGDLFEKSVQDWDGSSASFIKNFMNSDVAAHIDSCRILDEAYDIERMMEDLKSRYKARGSIRFSESSMFWIGYTYRYWSYVHGTTSRSIYSIANGTEMNGLFEAYHTLDCAKAIERILEAKGLKPQLETDIVAKHLGI